MSVIGLDLSLTAPGMIVDRVLGSIVSETLHTDSKRGDKRYCDIRDWLVYYVHDMPYSLAMIEDVPSGSNGGAQGSLDRVHGVAREVLARYDVPFAYVNLRAIKAFATGDGGAEKSKVMDHVEAETGKRPADDNQADAWVLHRMGHAFLGSGSEGYGLGTAQTQALNSVDWPLREGKWPHPYGPLRRKPVTKKCRHGVVCLKNGDVWLHPFTVSVCDKPPKPRGVR